MERNELSNHVDDLVEQLHDMEAGSKKAMAEIADLVDVGITSGEAISVSKFATVKDRFDLYETVVAELHTRLKAARLALWQFDLQALKDEKTKAIQSSTETRLEVVNVQADKVAFIRSVAKSGTTPEITSRIAGYDVLITDAKSRALTARNYLERIKGDLEAMVLEYNSVARENGWPLEPEKVGWVGG